MTTVVFRVQILVFECPCAKACRLQPPLDDLADRLRKEVRRGRDGSRRPFAAAADMETTLHTAPVAH